MNPITRIIQQKEAKVFEELKLELLTFLSEEEQVQKLSKRIYSLYYFLSCHTSYSDVMTSLNRFIRAKTDYSFSEIMIVRILKFKLEAPLLWTNKLIGD